MKISKQQSTSENWDKIKSWNYQLKHLQDYKSVVYAELDGDHGAVESENIEREYFIIEGSGVFDINGEATEVFKGDVITIPPHTKYNYHPNSETTLKVLLFMELWDN